MRKFTALLVLLLLATMTQAAFAITVSAYIEDVDEIRSAFAYTLDGVEYTFPTPVSELKANGWEVISPVTELDAMTYAKRDIDHLALQKNGALIEVSYLNATEEAKSIEDCTIGELTITPNRVMEPEEKRTAATKLFALANGTKVGNTFQEVLDNYGLTLHTVEQGTEESFDDYFDRYGGLMQVGVSATDGPKYVLLKDGKLYGSSDASSNDITIYFKIEEGFSLSQSSLSSQEVGENFLKLQFDRPLNEAGATVTEIWMQLWM